MCVRARSTGVHAESQPELASQRASERASERTSVRSLARNGGGGGGCCAAQQLPMVVAAPQPCVDRVHVVLLRSIPVSAFVACTSCFYHAAHFALGRIILISCLSVFGAAAIRILTFVVGRPFSTRREPPTTADREEVIAPQRERDHSSIIINKY